MIKTKTKKYENEIPFLENEGKYSQPVNTKLTINTTKNIKYLLLNAMLENKKPINIKPIVKYINK